MFHSKGFKMATVSVVHRRLCARKMAAIFVFDQREKRKLFPRRKIHRHFLSGNEDNAIPSRLACGARGSGREELTDERDESSTSLACLFFFSSSRRVTAIHRGSFSIVVFGGILLPKSRPRYLDVERNEEPNWIPIQKCTRRGCFACFESPALPLSFRK